MADYPTDSPSQTLPPSGDARVDLALLAASAERALNQRGTAEARARLAGLDTPDLLARTVQDGTARGLAVAYEEAISLCRPESTSPASAADANEDELGLGLEQIEGRQLRRLREFLVASGGARVRFSRKGGVLFVDRKHDVHEENCMWFEDREDVGDLDGFAPAPDGRRPRLFSPGFLRPICFQRSKALQRLTLEGRLGRTDRGFPCQLTIEGRTADSVVSMTLRLRNDHYDHRLRVRFLGCRNINAIGHDGTPGWEQVHHRGRWFTAATLVRAVGSLALADGQTVATPGAQCPGWIEHRFELGRQPWRLGSD